MTRRDLLAIAAAAPLSRGLSLAAEARKQIKITGLETDLLRIAAAQEDRLACLIERFVQLTAP